MNDAQRAQQERVLAASSASTSDPIYNAMGVLAYAAQCYDAVTAGRLTCPGVLNPRVRFETGGEGVNVNWGYSDDQLAVTAFNAVIGAIGQAAIVADTALGAVFGSCDPQDTSPEGSVRAVLYMVRCAFAHDPQAPKWECRGAFRQRYETRDPRLIFDGAHLDGRQMRLDDIGGLETYVRLLQRAREMVAKK